MSILAAFSLVFVIGFAALAVDVGAIFLESRRLQGVADLAAISAARDLDHAEAAAQATADLNAAGAPLSATVTKGRYASDPAIAAANRFVAGGAAANAVTVEVRGETPLYFGQIFAGRPTLTIVRRATAARAEFASLSIGSRLASLQGGVANAVLSGLAGGTVSLSVMDYDALANADVDLFKYVEALRVSPHVQAATFDDALATDITVGEALGVLADVLDTQGETQAGSAARKIAAAGNTTPAHLERLLDLGPYGQQDHTALTRAAEVRTGAMSLADGLLTAAKGGRQVKLDLGSSIPGLADTDVWLAIGERTAASPWLTIDHDGAVIVRTAQLRLYVEAKAAAGLGALGVQAVKLPVYVEMASAQAKITALNCPADFASQGVTLAVKPSPGQAAIGEVDVAQLNDFGHALTVNPARFVDLGVLKATGSAQVDLAEEAWKPLQFTRADISGGVVKSVASSNIVQAATGSLVSRLNLNVQVLGLGLSTGPITQALGSSLTAMSAPVDALLGGLTSILGVRVGEADVRVNGLRCRDAALVG